MSAVPASEQVLLAAEQDRQKRAFMIPFVMDFRETTMLIAARKLASPQEGGMSKAKKIVDEQ